MFTKLVAVLSMLSISVGCSTRPKEVAAPAVVPAFEPQAEPQPFDDRDDRGAAPSPARPGSSRPSSSQARSAESGTTSFSAPAAAAPPERASAGGAISGRAQEEYRARKSADLGESQALPAPQYRPGLATSWGETRKSPIRSAHFERRSSTPLEVARMQYDDEAGIRAATGAYALETAPNQLQLAQGALTFSVVDSSEDALPAARFRGTNYLVCDDGARYQLLITNRSSARFEIVASVDGLDVIDGRPGSLSKRGYLIAPHDSLLIEGFRKSEHDVATFRFGSVGESYAAQRGKSRNIGVIGVAVFDERDSDWQWRQPEAERREQAEPFPSRFAPAPESPVPHYPNY